MAVAAGLAAWCLLRLGFAVAWTSTGAATLALAACAVGVAALLIGVLAAIAEGPSRLALARRADAAFGLRERISTAIEFADAAPTAVSSALFADAEGRARTIRAKNILPRRSVARTLPLALLAAFAGALLLAPLPPVETDRVARPSAFVAAEEAAALATELRAIAAGIAADATRRNDAFLAAIAGAAAETAQRLAAGAPVERAALAADLARLGDYAAAAPAGALAAGNAEALSRLAAATAAGLPPSAASDRSRPDGGAAAPGATPAREEAARPATGPDGAAGTPGAADPGGAAAPDASPLAITAARPAAAPEVTGDAVQEPCNFDAGGDCAVAGGDDPFGLERGNVNVPPDTAGGAASPNAPEGPPMADGQLVGPAANAGAGEAVFAGQGARPVGDAPTDDPGALPAGGAMMLRDRGTGTGDRIRIDMPPPPGGTAVLEGAAPPAAADWRRLAEGAVARPRLSPAERAIAARYFARPPASE
jgi:hypothetical protein